MNLLSWACALGLLILLLVQGVNFHKATVCRQEAWLKSTELLTGAKLYDPKPLARGWHLGCRLHLLRNQELVTWQRLPNLKSHEFILHLDGQL